MVVCGITDYTKNKVNTENGVIIIIMGFKTIYFTSVFHCRYPEQHQEESTLSPCPVSGRTTLHVANN